MSLAVNHPLPLFFDAQGQPLDGGSIHIGLAGTSAESNPIAVFWDAAMTQPAAQPIITTGGVAAHGGRPSAIYVNASDYSLTLRDSAKNLILHSLHAVPLFGFPQVSGINPIDKGGTGAATRGAALSNLGGLANNVLTVGSARGIAESDRGAVLLCGGTFTLTLAAGALGAGFAFSVANVGTGVITLDPAGAETIDGRALRLIRPGESAVVTCSGTAFTSLGFTGFAQLSTRIFGTAISETLDDRHMGARVFYHATTPGTLTLPATPQIGDTIALTNISTGTCTVTRSGTPTIWAFGKPSLTSFVLTQGGSIVLMFEGTNWVQTVGDASIGRNQAWQNVTSSRALATTYTNDTGAPIQVSINISLTTTSATANLNVGGLLIAEAGLAQTAHHREQLTAIVPPVTSYRVDHVGSVLLSWFELR